MGVVSWYASRPTFGLASLLLTLLVSAIPGARASDVRCVPPNGCQAWAATFNGPANFADKIEAVAASPDGGRVYATGWAGSPGDFNFDWATIAYDGATGARIWLKQYGGAAQMSDAAEDVEVNSEGSTVFVTGWVREAAVGADMVTIAYEAATGDEVWVARYPGEGFAQAQDLALGRDDRSLFVLGSAANGFVLVAYDAGTGQERWAASYVGVREQLAVRPSPDGRRLFVTGARRPSPSNTDFQTVAFDASTGQVLWEASYAGAGEGPDDPYALEVAPDGSLLYVTGRSGEFDPDGKFVTLAYDVSTGALVWTAEYAGAGLGSEARAIGVSPWGDRVFVTRVSFGTGTFRDVVTIAYDAGTGDQAWLARFAGTRDDWPRALEVAPGGHRVYVTGLVTSTLAASSLTLAYDAATGQQSWQQEWDALNTRQEEALALALAGDGTRVVAGGFAIPATSSWMDWGAVAYGPLTLAPLAMLEADSTSGEAPFEVTFTLSGVDPDGLPDGWRLDVDGDHVADYQSPTGLPPPTLTHTYERAGSFLARLTVSDDHGAVGVDTVTVTVTGSAVAVPAPGPAAHGHGVLMPSFPNPFGGATTVRFILARPDRVRLTVHDLWGRRLRVLAADERGVGSYAVIWDGRDERGRLAPAGLYTTRLEVGALVRSEKVVVLR